MAQQHYSLVGMGEHPLQLIVQEVARSARPTRLLLALAATCTSMKLVVDRQEVWELVQGCDATGALVRTAHSLGGTARQSLKRLLLGENTLHGEFQLLMKVPLPSLEELEVRLLGRASSTCGCM